MDIYSLNDLRTKYEAAIQQGNAAEQFWDQLKDYDGLEGVTMGYKAASRALLAKHAWNPYHKLSYLKESMKLFQNAVQLEPENIEIRFLRFSTQHYLPDFLNENKNLEEDKTILMTYFPDYKEHGLEKEHAALFLAFFRESKRFTDDELINLEKNLS